MGLRRRPLEELASPGCAHLRPTLRALDLTLIGIGATVGSGIFVIVGLAVQPTGPAVSLSFAIAAVGSIFSALCYAELAARMPISGSVYLYAYVAFGEFAALLFALNLLIDYHVGAAVGVLSCATYLRDTLLGALGWDWLPGPHAICLALLALLTLMLCVGVERGLKRANGLLVATKVAIISLIIAVGLTKVRPANLRPFCPFGLLPVATTSTTCSFAYIGFGTIANAAEECVNPQRDVPIAITASLLACATLYVGFSLVLCGIVPFREIDEAAPVVAAFGPKYADVPWVGAFVDWGAIIGLYTTLLAGLYSQARMYLAMSRDGLLWGRLSEVSGTLGTPVPAQMLCSAVAAVLATCLPVQQLARFLNIGVLFSYTVVCAGVLVLRAERPEAAACWSLSLTAVSLLACSCPTWLGTSAASIGLYSILGALVVASSVPLLRLGYTPPSTFACPLCPLLPTLGIAVNGFLLSHCYWEAWLRLVLTTILIVAAYAVRVRRALADVSSSPADAAQVALGLR